MVAPTQEAAAPKSLHDQLDRVFPVLDHLRRMGMTSQVILYWTPDGKPGRFKVSASESDK